MKHQRLGTIGRSDLVIGRPTWHIASEHPTNEVDSAEMFRILDLLEAQKIADKGSRMFAVPKTSAF
jgi:hypothetical protein